MMARLVTLWLVVGMAAAAPVAEHMNAKEKTLVRSKRVKEVMVYGNHQGSHGSPQQKKNADPAVPLKVPGENAAAEEAGAKPVAAELPLGGSASRLVDVGADKADWGEPDALESLMSVGGEDLPDAKEETIDESSGDDGEEGVKNTGSEYDDYGYLYDYNSPWAEQLRKKRSTSRLSKPLTAEVMGGGVAAASKSSRVKRDLTQDEIRELLQNVVEEDVEDMLRGGGGAPSRFEEEEMQEQRPVYDPEPAPGWTREELETLAEADDSPRYGAEYLPTPTEEEVMAIEEAKARLALVRLLEEQEEEAKEAAEEEEREREAEAEAEVALALGYEDAAPYALEEEAMVAEPNDDVTYEPIIYNGVPGIFIPAPASRTRTVAKRQYLSLVPGMRKRTSSWYPEDTASRWDAFVPQEDKRAAGEYERLYRLAQALNRKK